MKQSELRLWGALVLIVTAAMSRLIPHAPNVTPIIAMALFSGATFQNRASAILIPIAAMLLSDLFLGFHDYVGVVYGSLLLIAAIGFLLRKKQSPLRIAGATVVSTLVFFFVTNFAVWFQSGMYPKTSAGLAACYVAALPFLRNGVLGDLFFSAAIFGVWALAVRALPQLSSDQVTANGR